MNTLFSCTCATISCTAKNFGLFILRVGIGLIFILHGYPKIMGGVAVWAGLGSSMKFFGIPFAPAAWGFAAACSEFFGGIALVLGLGTRIASLFMSCTMIVAVSFHVSKGDGFSVYSHALSLLVVFLALVCTGSGTFSCDNCLMKKK